MAIVSQGTRARGAAALQTAAIFSLSLFLSLRFRVSARDPINQSLAPAVTYLALSSSPVLIGRLPASAMAELLLLPGPAARLYTWGLNNQGTIHDQK